MKTPGDIKKGLVACINEDDINGTCGRCPYWGEEDGCKHIFEDSLAIIQQIQAENDEQARCIENLTDKLNAANESLPRWISVEEKLPEKHRVVLIHLKFGANMTGVHNGQNWWDDLGVANNNNVTHWMPLPQPPTPDK